tara:strand:+ start:415 stop:1002 length:588 start_codon:yes stop_codon:yes gene_type:complete
MEIQRLHRYLNKISPISEEAWADFFQIIEPVVLHKNEYLIREGSRAFRCFLLTDGVIRTFYNKNGNECNTSFFVPGMFPVPHTALLTNGPSRFTFQAVLSSRLIQFPYNDFLKLCERHQSLEVLKQRIFEQRLVEKEQHESAMDSNNATENYLIFQKTYPGLENLIPKFHIASYLGITPVLLKRIQTLMPKQIHT